MGGVLSSYMPKLLPNGQTSSDIEPLTSEPWRKTKNTKWDEEFCTEILNEINALGDEQSTRRANCLLLGPVGVGKSTFINSLVSVSKGRYSDMSYTANETWGSVTKQYCSYETNDKLKYINMWDTSGIMEPRQNGFNLDNIIALVEGHVKNGYVFNPENAIQKKDGFYNENPAVEDEIHCATFVMDARPGYDSLGDAYPEKIKTLQQKLMEKDIPRVLILTKCDRLCPYVEKETKTIYYSSRVKEAVDKASEVFRIPKSNIYPVVNYGQGQIYLEPETSVPLLLALRQINNSAKDHLEKKQKKEKKVASSVSDERKSFVKNT